MYGLSIVMGFTSNTPIISMFLFSLFIAFGYKSVSRKKAPAPQRSAPSRGGLLSSIKTGVTLKKAKVFVRLTGIVF